jgi:hypothetical protein
MSEDEMIEIVAAAVNKPKDVVRLAYRSQYKFIIDHIRALPLDKNMTKEEFDKLKTNFSLMDIGKLYCTWENVQKRRKYYKYIVPKIRELARKKRENENTE